MKRLFVLFAVVVLVAFSQTPNPAALKQLEIDKTLPQLQVTEQSLNLVVPNHTIGETEGVAKNSKGHLFVFSRSGLSGSARGGTASEIFEFDPNLKFVKMWGPNNYAASFAHAVRVDKYDNVWIVEEGANMVIKYSPNANVSLVLGRKPEAIDYLERFLERGEKIEEKNRWPVGGMGTYGRPTDIAWDSKDNAYISDGYTNSRFVKVDKRGVWGGAVGTHGSGTDQFSTVHAIAVDRTDRVWVGDRGNFRMPIYSGADMKNTGLVVGNAGAPWGECVTPGTPQYLYTGDGDGKIYKVDMSGKVVGWFPTRLNRGQTGCLIHTIHCESEKVLYTGSCSQWSVDKITIQ